MGRTLINEEEKKRILGMHKSYGYTISEQPVDPLNLQNRLAVLYIMKTKNLDKAAAEKYLKYQESGYDNFITKFDGQNEDYMDWLESIGLERGDVYVDDGNKERVLTKLEDLEKLNEQ